MTVVEHVHEPDPAEVAAQNFKRWQAHPLALALTSDAISGLASRGQWERLPDVVYSLRGMLDGAGSMKRADIAVLSDAFGILRELLLRRPAEYGGPRECR